MTPILRLVAAGCAAALPASGSAAAAEHADSPVAAQTVTQTETVTSTPPPAPKDFGSVVRLQVRYLSGGAGTVSEGAFILLPWHFNVAQLVELTRNDNEWDVTGEAKLARAFAPESRWGRALGGVARLQVSDMYSPVLGAGLQWNITDTPGIDDVVSGSKIKSLLQVFTKTDAEYAGDEPGLIDWYHWYQVPLTDGLFVRGVNAYFEVQGAKDHYFLMQDLIHPLTDRVDIFFHHIYRNTEFGGEPDGSRWGLGVRVALW